MLEHAGAFRAAQTLVLTAGIAPVTPWVGGTSDLP